MKQHIYSFVYQNRQFPSTSPYFTNHQVFEIIASDASPSLLHYFPSSNPSNSLLFFFHGNGDPKWRLEMLCKIRQVFDCNICFPIYRCHCTTLPRRNLPTESGMVRDILACFDTLRSKDLLKDDTNLVLFGLSLGGAILTSFLASHLDTLHPRPKKIILDTTFTTMTSVFKYYQRHQDITSYIPGNRYMARGLARVIKYLPITWLIWIYLYFIDDLYDSSKHLQEIFKKHGLRCKVLILGATMDKITPVQMSRDLGKVVERSSGGECVPQVVEMECNHGCCTDVEGFYELIVEFISKD